MHHLNFNNCSPIQELPECTSPRETPRRRLFADSVDVVNESCISMADHSIAECSRSISLMDVEDSPQTIFGNSSSRGVSIQLQQPTRPKAESSGRPVVDRQRKSLATKRAKSWRNSDHYRNSQGRWCIEKENSVRKPALEPADEVVEFILLPPTGEGDARGQLAHVHRHHMPVRNHGTNESIGFRENAVNSEDHSCVSV